MLPARHAAVARWLRLLIPLVSCAMRHVVPIGIVAMLVIGVLGVWQTVSAPAPRISAWHSTGSAALTGSEALTGAAVMKTNAYPAPAPARSTQLDTYLTTLAQNNQWSGAALVANHGSVLLSKGYGMADVQQQIANGPTTRFHLASLSKQF